MEILKTLRNKKGYTQKEAALYLGVSQQAYGNYETGKREPDNDMLIKIANLYETTVDSLLGRTTEEYVPDITEDLLSSSNHSKSFDSWMIGWEADDDSVDSDLKTAITMQSIDRAIKQQGANTYIIHGSDGKGTVVTTNIPKDKYLLVGEGDISELTKKEYGALKSVLDAMNFSSEDD